MFGTAKWKKIGWSLLFSHVHNKPVWVATPNCTVSSTGSTSYGTSAPHFRYAEFFYEQELR